MSFDMTGSEGSQAKTCKVTLNKCVNKHTCRGVKASGIETIHNLKDRHKCERQVPNCCNKL